MSKIAIDTERSLDNTCSSRTYYQSVQNIDADYLNTVSKVVDNATANGHLIICIIDDYTSIHTNRRPTDEKASKATHMTTVVIRVFENIPAITFDQTENVHNPVGIDANLLTNHFSSDQVMSAMGKSFASTMPSSFSSEFFSPETERRRLETHEYKDSENVRKLRQLENLRLLEFRELPLKSFSNFEQAMEWITEGPLRKYLDKYVLLTPGDYPAQYYVRHVAYRHSYHGKPDSFSSTYNKTSRQTYLGQKNHYHMQGFSLTSECISKETNTTLPPHMETLIRDPFQAFVSLLGPLHISLNAQEDIIEVYHSFFKTMYEEIFPGSKLADKPKPWRRTLILELVFGGWTLIRNDIRKAFQNCKSKEYQIIVNLLDNYIPLSLSTYSVIFKLNLFEEYFMAVVRIWIMFYCFNRKNYNKAPLVWLSNILFWKRSCPNIFETIKKSLHVTDEYPVENTHSILRANTSPNDSASELTKKAKMLFQSKANLHNFSSVYTPPKSFTFSKNQLKYLKLQTAKFLVRVFKFISGKTQESDSLDPHLPTDDVRAFPLAYRTCRTPNPNLRCDLPGCPYNCTDLDWQVFEGCGHSFDMLCIKDSEKCAICTKHICEAIKKLADVAQASMFKDNEQSESGTNETTPADTNDSTPAVKEIDDKELESTILSLKQEILSLSPPAPSYNATFSVQPIPMPITKQPHCTICSHMVKGLKKSDSQEKFCPLCPQQKYSSSGKAIPCICQQH